MARAGGEENLKWADLTSEDGNDEPDNGLAVGSMPSVGSRSHYVGRCKPCAFFHTKGCLQGSECSYCHLCPPHERERRKRLKQHLYRNIMRGDVQPRMLSRESSNSSSFSWSSDLWAPSQLDSAASTGSTTASSWTPPLVPQRTLSTAGQSKQCFRSYAMPEWQAQQPHQVPLQPPQRQLLLPQQFPQQQQQQAWIPIPVLTNPMITPSTCYHTTMPAQMVDWKNMVPQSKGGMAIVPPDASLAFPVRTQLVEENKHQRALVETLVEEEDEDEDDDEDEDEDEEEDEEEDHEEEEEEDE